MQDMIASQDILSQLRQSRSAAQQLACLPAEAKNKALARFATLVEEERFNLLQANEVDLARERGRLSGALYQRLKLDPGKISQLGAGIRDVAALPDPTGKVLSKTLLDDGLLLEQVTVPLGVIAIIFESRPDVIPQILALALKSGNAVVLKGGSEAIESNRAFMQLVNRLTHEDELLPEGWATLVDSREAIHAVLGHPEYVDLVIPRGSNQLVQTVMQSTTIPVLGHADGVCHIYVHPSADLDRAIPLIIDAKSQYPSACNATETVLLDEALPPGFVEALVHACREAGIALRGDDTLRARFGMPPVEDWHTEYGELTLALGMVPDSEAAIAHINTYGSHHTDCILAREQTVIDRFLAGVDSASVFANASTRFADGYRYGLGAEIGISTSRTHARGPVGLEGLVTTKYLLQGAGQRVADYVGAQARPFVHKRL